MKGESGGSLGLFIGQGRRRRAVIEVRVCAWCSEAARHGHTGMEMTGWESVGDDEGAATRSAKLAWAQSSDRVRWCGEDDHGVTVRATELTGLR